MSKSVFTDVSHFKVKEVLKMTTISRVFSKEYIPPPDPAYELKSSGEMMNHLWVSHYQNDGIVVKANGCNVSNCTIIDNLDGWVNVGHRDGVQIIPSDPHIQNIQYAAAEISDIKITGNHIRSNGYLQGIFCSDGLICNIEISNNIIQTRSQHFISLTGLISGKIYGNVRENGQPCDIHLKPLRIGGNPGDGNLWILSFSDSTYRYLPVEYIVNKESLPFTIDNRQKIFSKLKGDEYLYNFDIKEFRIAARKLLIENKHKSTNDNAIALQNLAKKFGDKVRL
ncbi:hypothetical protein [Thiothrix fructosivorans]|uniref:Uncharacterized protein n=1 Tax=Thiothrix fructosivorans TaxID=111770 RepID=A0A8B0SLP7_9GAMM|nr:hypothetical protein [Thiothrix fructosivorans]MBO0612646.1 hypothetical protein [Thiothrix fructosivorans]QTX11884.1 hypothetical protein J1836_005980 [Thiothrix fructosivorans]